MSPTFVESLIAGGAAGTAVDLLFFPIDTLKTRLQSSQGFARAGGFKGIYKGIGSVVVGSAPGAAAFFSTYDTMKKTLPFPDRLAPVNHVVSASMGEIAACLIRVPTEVIKTRMQTYTYGAGHSSLAAAQILWTSNGIRGFYRGFGITVMREIPFTSIQFPLYELLKLRASGFLGRKPLYAHEAAICGSIAGGFAAAITTPLDVLKTRIMLDMRVHPLSILQETTQHSPSAFMRFHTIYAQEGMKALFAGVVPRTMWISAGGAVFLGVYEWVAGGLISYRTRTA
ncbi:mitochondrial carrier [Gymnopus androsaceus JB14]|uniref:Mitochondrial carrier n=1 Tax=Gymnopus androsaceus JB14 TaxID=1447944 RepID=A0A6A4I057_9AGAR|nr:mitochondrial carrier [Gymnopus androsaceus JB14]